MPWFIDSRTNARRNVTDLVAKASVLIHTMADTMTWGMQIWMVGEGQTNLRDAIAIAKDIKCKLQERKIDVLMIQSMLEDVVLFRSLKL